MKIAVILFNLGGPDSLEAVQPFLRNLFSDPAIITLPAWLRLPLARFIASRRTPKATAIYAKIGGSSPILGQTEAQARALEEALGSEHEWRGYVCMRYWHPMTEAVVGVVGVPRWANARRASSEQERRWFNNSQSTLLMVHS